MTTTKTPVRTEGLAGKLDRIGERIEEMMFADEHHDDYDDSELRALQERAERSAELLRWVLEDGYMPGSLAELLRLGNDIGADI